MYGRAIVTLIALCLVVLCAGQQQDQKQQQQQQQQQQPSCEELKEDRRAQFGVQRTWPPRSAVSRVTLVLISWRRPNRLTWLLEQYTSYLLVGEIIVMHNRREGASLERPFRHPKVLSVDNYFLFKTYGHAAGFKGCLLARHPWVVIVRDVILLSEPGLQLLVGAKAEGSADRTYAFSFHKSGVADEEDKGKDNKESAAVSAAMIVDQRMCRLFFDFVSILSIGDVLEASGNGGGSEGIFMSLVVWAKTGNRPVVLPKSADLYQVLEQEGSTGQQDGGERAVFHDRPSIFREAQRRLACFFPRSFTSANTNSIFLRKSPRAPGGSSSSEGASSSIDSSAVRRLPEQNWTTSLASSAIATTTSPHRLDLFFASAPLMERYARRAGADFLCMSLSLPTKLQSAVDINRQFFARTHIEPYISKLLIIGRLLQAGYIRVLWLDDSALLLPRIDNIFKMVSDAQAEVAAFDEGGAYPFLSSVQHDRLLLAKRRNVTLGAADPYFNTGVLVTATKELANDLSASRIEANIDLFYSKYADQAYVAYLLLSHSPPLRLLRLTEQFNFMLLHSGYKGNEKKDMRRSLSEEELRGTCNQSIVHLTGHTHHRRIIAQQIADECS